MTISLGIEFQLKYEKHGGIQRGPVNIWAKYASVWSEKRVKHLRIFFQKQEAEDNHAICDIYINTKHPPCQEIGLYIVWARFKR